jgi:hypothetical protein
MLIFLLYRVEEITKSNSYSLSIWSSTSTQWYISLIQQ